VLCDQLRSLDWIARRGRLAFKLPAPILEDVLAKARTLLH
jgi:hypothetical protein